MEGFHIFSPGKMPMRYEESLVDFLFPYEKKGVYLDRIIEINLYRQYMEQSYTFIHFKDDQIVATARSIWKRNENEFLPIEASYVTDVKDSEYGFVKGLQYAVPVIPSFEVGGLKVSEGLPFKERSRIMMNLFKVLADEGFRLKGAIAYATCDPNLVRLYTDKDYFSEMAIVTYDNKIFWAALVRNMCLKR